MAVSVDEVAAAVVVPPSPIVEHPPLQEVSEDHSPSELKEDALLTLTGHIREEEEEEDVLMLLLLIEETDVVLELPEGEDDQILLGEEEYDEYKLSVLPDVYVDQSEDKLI